MLRPFVCAILALVFSTGLLLAEFIEGKAKTIDTDKNTITVTVDGKDRTFRVDDKVTVYDVIKDKRFKPNKKGLKAIKEGEQVKLTRAPESAEEKDPVVTEIYHATLKKKMKKNQ